MVCRQRGRIRMRSLGLALGLPAVLAAFAVAAPSNSLGAGGTPICATDNLRLDLVSSSAATSHQFWDLGLRNVGPQTCHLRGYPGVGLLDANANLINVTVARATGHTVKSVVLHPWQRTTFTFEYVTSGPCIPHDFSAYGLRVIPPNDVHGLVWYAGKFDLCDVSVGGQPQVTPVG
jgi:hypothetical protein